MSSVAEEFPWVTFILLAINTFCFLLSMLADNPEFIWETLGFVPQHPRLHSLITYMFFHVDFIHLLGNMIMFLSIGIILEEIIGSKNFLLVYVVSGIVAVPFDVLGRFIFGIPLDYPLIGSSGAIFGILTMAAILKPFGRIATSFVVLLWVPMLLRLSQMIDIGELARIPSLIESIVGGLIFVAAIAFILRPTTPLLLAFPVFLLFMILQIVTHYISVSFMGHTGGVIGGLLSLFILRKKRFD